MEMETEQEKQKEEQEINKLCYDLLGIGYLDLQKLNEYCQAGKKYDYDFMGNVKDDFEDFGGFGNKINEPIVNSILYCAVDRLFYLIIEDLEQQDLTEEEKEKIAELKDNFSPFINACDSWFNNCFDELDLSKTKEEITKEAKELINNELEK